MASVHLKDNSIQVKAALNDTTIAWLYEAAHSVESHAKRNCQLDGDEGKKLAGSYQAIVDEGKGEAQIGSPLEAAYWEEWGTGEYAAHGDGRKGWWIYIEGEASQGGGQTYNTREEAEAMAAYIRRRYGKHAVVTNGRKPSYTLQHAFEQTTPKSIEALEDKLKGGVGD